MVCRVLGFLCERMERGIVIKQLDLDNLEVAHKSSHMYNIISYSLLLKKKSLCKYSK